MKNPLFGVRNLLASALNIIEPSTSVTTMATSKKYQSRIEPAGSGWVAQITRRVTAKKVVVTKQQDGFASETEATAWAEATLPEFTSTLSSSNQRHGQQRKQGEEQRRLRSARRAEKTLQAKEGKLATIAAAKQKLEDEVPMDPAADLASEYDFGPEED